MKGISADRRLQAQASPPTPALQEFAEERGSLALLNQFNCRAKMNWNHTRIQMKSVEIFYKLRTSFTFHCKHAGYTKLAPFAWVSVSVIITISQNRQYFVMAPFDTQVVYAQHVK
jgi:hypothetical protein